MMQGVQFMIDEAGEKTAVVIDLKKHGRLWEDFYDHVQIEKTRREPRKALDRIEKELKKEGRL